ncbi:MAG: starch-binding protein, partial [Lachnospiraceae bacterium]|nr:starch-binding protein [Lachnospiraceae bacterium]
MLKRKHNRFVCRLLAVTIAATSIFATSPVTQAETVEVKTEASQVAAEDQIILHAKGTGLNIYAWKDQEEAFGAWPGKAMDADPVMGNGWVTVTFDAGFKFIINGNGGQSDDLSKAAGEYWYVDGKLYDSDPEGPATPTPVPTPGPLNIVKVTPEDGTALKAGEVQAITVDASSTINDGVVYYKYEVKCEGEYVGDHYYSKNNTYSFTPEDGKEYTVKISVQAHDEANTTVTKELKYKGSANGTIVTAGPEESETPETIAPQTKEPDVPETETPASGVPTITTQPSETNIPGTITTKPDDPDVPTAKPDDPDVPTAKPGNTNAPTAKPGNTDVPTAKPGNTNAPTAKPGNTNAPTA